MGGPADRTVQGHAAIAADRPGRITWSVRRHMVTIVGAVLVVFAVATSIAVREVLAGARRNVASEAADLSSHGAELLGASIALGVGQLGAIAAHPALPAFLAQAGPCPLEFNLELVRGGRIDIVRPDGRIACSSNDDVVGASHAGAPWLAEPGDPAEQVHAPPIADGPTGEIAMVVAVPAHDAGGSVIGTVAMVLPTGGIGHRLAEVLAGPRGYDFALVDTRTTALLSSSADHEGPRPGDTDAGLDPLAAGGFVSGSQPVDGTTWRVVTGLDGHAATARANAALRRGALVAAAVLVVLLASLSIVYRRIALPLRRLTEAVGRAGPHVGEALDLVRGPAEVVQLAHTFRAAISTHERYQEQLLHQALHDPLTGLPNRALLAERLSHSLEQGSRSRLPVAVLFLDIDRFKLVNEGLGHAVGDEVLLAIASRLREIIRPGDTLARFGGDEFVVVAEGVADRDHAEHLAERLLAVVQSPVAAGGTTVRVSASIGIALSDRSSVGADLISDADNAMYLAKENGRSRHEVFDLSLRDRVTTRLTVANELRVALERGSMHLVYQPQIDLTSGRTTGVEALLRWEHPRLGSISPATFIPIAEDTGSILPLGRFVLGEACRQAARWRSQGLDLTVSVNLSGRQLAEPSLVQHVAWVLQETGVEASQLCLELTESVLMSDTPLAAEALGELHALGVQLSIDDFGTGYSSLAYLHRFPVDHLKIDRTFIHGMTERPDQRDLVGAMVAMGSALGMQIVAEGVETSEQAAHLRDLGCHTAQGYLFAAPALPATLNPMLRRSAGSTTAAAAGRR